MRDYLAELPTPHRAEIESLLSRCDKLEESQKKGVTRYRRPFEAIRHLRAEHLDFGGDTVVIGRRDELGEPDRRLLHDVLRGFMPWRKGPYEVFGIEIDAEWRSERKWQRLRDNLPDLTGKTIADIGSNNGYYLFRMAAHRPRLALGFEPHLHHHFTFKTLNSLAGRKDLASEMLGVEQLGLFENCFDVIFMMGILYHRISPIEVLRETLKALRPGGTLLVESQAIPGEEPIALFPEKTYAKAPGTYFVPTAVCLVNWLTRTGFLDVELFHSHPMSSAEQRRTAWMEFESYENFIDPANPQLTVEGYPAPHRVFIKARKKD
ncbi:MAG: tRNA 5-methoxyuridine(34)/uridine 5-oxyacetic acid(34) synthase CmoB [Desulfurivibrionaceae bacterium]|nr:tRNA 5-methoxyuridine(34)/uridine 5-oxyacetic acid(34) synthase CmoB [Desulfobulbales bacterium]MDT8334336.1 tRNA 5-methoxyuridine(34)/uridine 5-oxyacetic acid(34) synthase CmoB [Desulfurivibrionaceae bacterium]